MRKALTMLTATAALVLATGAAMAAIPDSGGVIHGCYRLDGLLRVIDKEAGQTCRPSETELSWNQTGPQGPQGPAGPTGATGATGPQGEPGPGTDAFSVEARGPEVTVPTTPGGTVLLQGDVPAGKYVVIGNVVLNNLNASGTIPVLCWLDAPGEISPLSVTRIDPFRFVAPDQPSGASAATLPLTMTTELTAPGTLRLVCQSNTGLGGLTALAGARKITAIRVATLAEE